MVPRTDESAHPSGRKNVATRILLHAQVRHGKVIKAGAPGKVQEGHRDLLTCQLPGVVAIQVVLFQ